MTKRNNLTFFEGAEVSETRNNQYYRVALEEECITIYVRNEIVQNVCEKSPEEAVLVAILFAYIEYIRRSTSTDTQTMKRIDEKCVVIATIKLLKNYPIETLISYVKTLKWHEVEKVFKSSKPAEELEEII